MYVHEEDRFVSVNFEGEIGREGLIFPPFGFACVCVCVYAYTHRQGLLVLGAWWCGINNRAGLCVCVYIGPYELIWVGRVEGAVVGGREPVYWSNVCVCVCVTTKMTHRKV